MVRLEDTKTRRPLPTAEEVKALAAQFEAKSAEDLIRWTFDTFGGRAAFCTSFQAEGMAILDMLHEVDPSARVFTIDTGRLPQETYDLIDRARERYGMAIEVYYPDHEELASMVAKHGINPFYRSYSLRLLCCELRKVHPLSRVLKDLDAWVTGLMRTQSSTRAETQKIERDEVHGGIIKVNPLADWDSSRVWDYLRANNVPYNALYDRGYTSIGCAPCTRAIGPGEDPRAGRWWWEKGMPKECGIHPAIVRRNGGSAKPG
ncbi:MAG: phosphoadenylyl-sulfate reductase [SAR202 cluster bacterium]|nr:phosphoadenylyl-sulfate reductase [SAR202 cluster bacterium]